MKIISLSRWDEPDKSGIYWRLRASDNLPLSAGASVLISYVKTIEHEKVGDEAKPPDEEVLVESRRPLQNIQIDGNTLTGYISIADIEDGILEDYKFNTTVSNVTIDFEDGEVAEASVKEKLDEITEYKGRPVKVWLKTRHTHYLDVDSSFRDTTMFSNAVIDPNKQLVFQFSIDQENVFPNSFAPGLLKADAFQELLDTHPRTNIKKNGHCYIVQYEDGSKKLAVLFVNTERVYAEYYNPSDVYRNVNETGARMEMLDTVDTIGFKKERLILYPYTSSTEFSVKSEHFKYELEELVTEYPADEIYVDQRYWPDSLYSNHNSISQIGSYLFS